MKIRNDTGYTKSKDIICSPSTVSSGIPQGSVLGPLLFLCCINDITCGASSSIKLYADDILIYRIINTEDDCKMLQRDLDLLQSWAHKWNMSFNSMKCEFLRITNKQNKIFFSYSIQDTLIKEVTRAKYLGITLNSSLTWSDYIANITSKPVRFMALYAEILIIAQLKSKVHYI